MGEPFRQLAVPQPTEALACVVNKKPSSSSDGPDDRIRRQRDEIARPRAELRRRERAGKGQQRQIDGRQRDKDSLQREIEGLKRGGGRDRSEPLP